MLSKTTLLYFSVKVALWLNITAAISVPVKADAAYTTLAETYTSGDFFQKFDFFTGRDPTNGHVQYVIPILSHPIPSLPVLIPSTHLH